jgi:hypothetical protein
MSGKELAVLLTDLPSAADRARLALALREWGRVSEISGGWDVDIVERELFEGFGAVNSIPLGVVTSSTHKEEDAPSQTSLASFMGRELGGALTVLSYVRGVDADRAVAALAQFIARQMGASFSGWFMLDSILGAELRGPASAQGRKVRISIGRTARGVLKEVDLVDLDYLQGWIAGQDFRLP